MTQFLIDEKACWTIITVIYVFVLTSPCVIPTVEERQ